MTARARAIQPYYVIGAQPPRARRSDHQHRRRPHQIWAAQYATLAARLWLTSGSMGTMGFGCRGDRRADHISCAPVIDIDGDSSIRMNIGELETVTTYDLPVKVMVLNNWRRHGEAVAEAVLQGPAVASDRSLHKKTSSKAAQADGFRYAVRLSARKRCRG
jgi:acetolactate synthase-1/2/3 large subunit